LVMIGGFDVGQAVGAGLGGRRRALEFIDEFAAAWTRPLVREDGYGQDVLQSVEDHLGVRLPAALREAYLVLGKRTDLTAVQDPLLPPGRLRVDEAEGVIVFRRENQGCAEWGVAPADPWNPEDPPVRVRPDGRPWEPFAARMSLACAEMVLSEVLLGARFMAMCDASGEPGAAAAQSAYQRVALPEYPLWCDTAVTSRWFAAPGKLLRVDGQGPYCWLVAAGQAHRDLKAICEAIPGDWQRSQLPARRRSAFAGDLTPCRNGCSAHCKDKIPIILIGIPNRRSGQHGGVSTGESSHAL
jgi:hypothetical protein